MTLAESRIVPRLNINLVLSDKLYLDYFKEFLTFKHQRLITLHKGKYYIKMPKRQSYLSDIFVINVSSDPQDILF